MRLFVLSVLVLGLIGCQPSAPTTEGNTSEANNVASNTPATDSNTPAPDTSGLKPTVTDLKPGAGEPSVKGDRLFLTYKATTPQGQAIDDNLKPESDPYQVVIGEGMALPGFEMGVTGMNQGMKRKLEIPYQLGYGEEGMTGKVPPKQDLVYEVECLFVLRESEKDKLIKEDIKVGTGPEVKDGDKVSVHYTGTLINGKKFDSSKDRGTPYELVVGAPGVIQGWIQGIAGMKVGGVRKLIIPPALGYGEQGSPPNIPGNSVLMFELELVKKN